MHSNKAFYCSGKCALKERFYLNEIYMIEIKHILTKKKVQMSTKIEGGGGVRP